MKKVLSLVLVVALAFSAIPCYALATNSVLERENAPYIQEIEKGYFFFSSNDLYTYTMLTDEDANIVEVNFKFEDQPQTVYQFYLYDFLTENFDGAMVSSWDPIATHCLNNLSQAQVIHFTETVPQENLDTSSSNRSSYVADLTQDMYGLVGYPFSGSLRHSAITSGQTIKIYEEMSFDFSERRVVSWSSAMSVGALITNVLGKVVKNGTVSAICKAMGVALNVASMLTAGSMKEYNCSAIYDKYATVNNSNYMYNITYKYIDYVGYENNAHNNPERAYVDSDSGSAVTYSHGAAYYNNHASQVADAYNMFCQVGQMP